MRRPPAAPAPSKWTEPARRLRHLDTLAATTRRDLRRRRWLRLHVFMIALLTLGSLWLACALFMHAGIGSLGLRYALALPVAYGLYLLLLRLWAHWLARHGEPPDDGWDAAELGLDMLDSPGCDAAGGLADAASALDGLDGGVEIAVGGDDDDGGRGGELAELGEGGEPIHAWQPHVEEDHARQLEVAIRRLAADVERRERLVAVAGGPDLEREVRATQRAQRDVEVFAAVVHQQDRRHQAASFRSGSARNTRAPRSGSASIQARPPWRSATRRTMASPTPAPGNSSRPWSRSNTPKSLSAKRMSKPTPSSLTQ